MDCALYVSFYYRYQSSTVLAPVLKAPLATRGVWSLPFFFFFFFCLEDATEILINAAPHHRQEEVVLEGPKRGRRKKGQKIRRICHTWAQVRFLGERKEEEQGCQDFKSSFESPPNKIPV